MGELGFTLVRKLVGYRVGMLTLTPVQEFSPLARFVLTLDGAIDNCAIKGAIAGGSVCTSRRSSPRATLEPRVIFVVYP
ncbi:MAG: hypothetical protein ACRC8Y_04610 [Chroococcales cyanobacterium]